MNNFKDLILNYKNKINEISKSNLNENQRNLILEVLNLYSQKENCTEEELHNLYNLLIQRIKVGFTFDVAPSTITDAISYLEKNESLSFVNDSSKPKNQLIIGENFDALKNLLLVERDEFGYDVIYIHPPYNADSAREEGNSFFDEEDSELLNLNNFIYKNKFSRNGWLNIMNERLNLARDLLKETGLILVSIYDNEHAYLKVLMDEIFGEENFVTNITRLKKKLELQELMQIKLQKPANMY